MVFTKAKIEKLKAKVQSLIGEIQSEFDSEDMTLAEAEGERGEAMISAQYGLLDVIDSMEEAQS